MATVDTMTLTGFLAMKLANRRAKRAERVNTGTRVQVLIRLVMHIFGFSCLTIAGFWAHPIVGFVVAGFSWFTLSWLVSNTSNTENTSGVPRLR